MKQEYFIYNGIQYDSGTPLIVTDTMSRNHTKTLATFICFDTDTNEYHIRIRGTTISRISQGEFDAIYHGVWDRSNKTGPVKPIPASVPKHKLVAPNEAKQNHLTFQDEFNIDGLLVAWVWYIFIMAVGVIFHDRIGIWIFASVVFFRYRSKKLREAGYK